ncbi:MAG: peptide deformylase [Patescibacteria group bacterium]
MPIDILPIVKNPTKVLRRRAEAIRADEIATPKIQRLIKAMKATLAETPDGVGLAASQVGETLRLFIVSAEADQINKSDEQPDKEKEGRADERAEIREKRTWTYDVYINPVVLKQARKKISDAEGCLSVPGKFGIVRRVEKITVEALDEAGKKVTKVGTRFVARVIQHELDHLDGVLFIDKVDQWLDTP